jgi:hypothetical protein
LVCSRLRFALPLLVLSLFAPYALFTAQVGLSLRDMMILVYISYLIVGATAAALVDWGAQLDRAQASQYLGRAGFAMGAVVLAVVVLGQGARVSQTRVDDPAEDWDNPHVHEVAAWISANIEPGAQIMSTRLYYSHVYFLTGGRYPVYQLPTVEATPEIDAAAGEPALTRRGSLFRWENHRLPDDSPSDRWIYLTRQPERYFIGLAEDDLLADLREREIDYLLVTTQDAGFSSVSMLAYFEANPAFTLVHQFAGEAPHGGRVYKVDMVGLAQAAVPLQVTRPAFAYVSERLGEEGAAAYFQRLNPAGYSLTAR